MSTYPALDFLREVEIWQTAPGGTAGLAVALPDSENATLAGLLAQVRDLGPSTRLESQARYWLVGYRQMNPPLAPEQRAELDGLIAGFAFAPVKIPTGRKARQPEFLLSSLAVTYVLIAMFIMIAGGLAISALVTGSGNGSPPAAGAPVNPGGPVPGALTDLQQFRADWNAPAAASASAGNPAGLVLLQDGLYYPVPWGVRAGDPGWQPDTTGSVTAMAHGPGTGLWDVTDSDGTTWTVNIGQPFVLASNPQAVFRVLRNAAVQTIPQPHAIAVRVPVKQKG